MKERNPVDDQLNDEFVISDQSVQKKLTEESVPYVVQVGEQEEDLDYDLKNENNSSSECTGPGKKVQNMVGESIKSEEKPESAAVTQQISENRKNLWISNLPKLVKAADLKQHFSRAGKVVSATVVMSTRTPGGCFGSIQMASAEDAATAVSIYDSTEFGGCILRVEATERKAPIQSNNLNDRISGLNKVKASNLPDSQRMTSKSMVSRKRYIANRRTQLRRIAIRNAILREQRRKSEFLSTHTHLHSSKSVPVRRSTHPLTRQKYAISKDTSRSRGRLARISRYQSIPQQQRPLRTSANQGAQSLSYRRLGCSSNRIREAHRIHKRESSSRQSSKPFLSDLRKIPNSYSGSGRTHPSSSSHLSYADPPTTKRYIPTFHTDRSMGKDIRGLQRPIPSDRRHHAYLQSPGRSYDSSRYAREVQQPVYAEKNTFKSVYDDGCRQSNSVLRPEPYYVHRTDFGGRKVSVSSRLNTYHSERYRTPENHVSEMRSTQLRSNQFSRLKLEDTSREYRAVSRSPPRSRDPTMMRPYPVSTNFSRHRSEVSRRSRSPPVPHSLQHRPEILEYGHRSEPKTNWQAERRSRALPSPSQNQSWRQPNHAFFVSSTYDNRAPARRY
ncbi:unnamed protein product [Heterobilharzia americana]|nr:unnamed protein product [Heterobilharzia americana]